MELLKIGVVSLGCDKNRIDSEILLNQLSGNYTLVTNEKEADVIIVNTCGFIESAKEESINTILEMAEYKTQGVCKALVVTGCLSQRYGKELAILIPEIDILLGVNEYKRFNNILEEYFNSSEKIISCDFSDSNINEGNRILTTGNFTAYLRISEGCDNFCTYCIIPKIRGKYRSRDIESICSEAEKLVGSGVKEIILIAQDTTRYGIDIYHEKMLPKLLKKLSEISNLKWIRLLYCYPEEITEELIVEIKNNDKICKYIDIPVQHISNNILKAMGRRGSKEQILKIISKLKENIPNITIRTTLIVGFPGETEEDFLELYAFVRDNRFEKLGVFKYSQEEDTPAANFENQIDEDLKEKRFDTLMKLQQSNSKEINLNKVNKIYECIICSKTNNTYTARSFEMSPDIDGSIKFISQNDYNLGAFVCIKITKAHEYDLVGVVYNESCK
ncbi:MAG TPA: 30S ribosomal protein S12 methylthiotransferase RimO [Clostridiaceae bacterium]